VERQQTGGGAGALTAGAIVVVLGLLAAGIGYEQAGRVRDRERLPRIGRAVDIGGRTLNIFCSGTGSRTVILVSNAPFSGYSWLLVQRRVAVFTRACWYDAAGLGWSDPAPGPADSAAIARDLHALLQAADVPPPYVLVGNGAGGFHVRVFAARYPKEIAGIVLADSAQEDQDRRMPWIKGPVPNFLRPAQSWMAQVAGATGVTRLVAKQGSGRQPRPSGLTDEEWATITALRQQSKTFPALTKETAAWERDAEEARAAGGLRDWPLVVLSSARLADNSEHERVNRELQEDLAHLSSRGKRQLVEVPSFEWLPYTAPEAIAAAVREGMTP
jgi:pimeloyl-ACP methyl ester carboxylesterase